MNDLAKVTLRSGLGLPKRRLGLAAAPALNEQHRDEHRLQTDETDGADDGPAVLLPERPLGEDDLAALGQALLVELPAGELPAVEPVRAPCVARHRRAGQGRAAYQPGRQDPGIAADVLELQDRPAHHSTPERQAEWCEDGTVRGFRDVRNEVDTVKAPPGAIDLIARLHDDGVLRQL